MFWTNCGGPPRVPNPNEPNDPDEHEDPPPYSVECMWEIQPGQICRRTLRQLEEVAEHVNRHIFRVPERAPNFCRWHRCPRYPPFMDRESLFHHVSDHLQEGAHRCPFRRNGCYRLFETVANARAHGENCRHNYGREVNRL